jgi:multidrug efflux pump subunit AcrA (membrane-fusion protein)
VEGTVIDVSPDAVRNKEDVSYYKVTIAPSTTQVSTQEGDVTLRSGLSVSAEIITERRSVLGLLLEPARRLKNGIS